MVDNERIQTAPAARLFPRHIRRKASRAERARVIICVLAIAASLNQELVLPECVKERLALRRGLRHRRALGCQGLSPDR